MGWGGGDWEHSSEAKYMYSRVQSLRFNLKHWVKSKQARKQTNKQIAHTHTQINKQKRNRAGIVIHGLARTN